MLHIIYTEDKNRDLIENIVSAKTDGFTIVEGEGFWKGQSELSIQIHLVGLNSDVVEGIIAEINKVNDQCCCLLLSIPCEVAFL